MFPGFREYCGPAQSVAVLDIVGNEPQSEIGPDGRHAEIVRTQKSGPVALVPHVMEHGQGNESAQSLSAVGRFRAYHVNLRGAYALGLDVIGAGRGYGYPRSCCEETPVRHERFRFRQLFAALLRRPVRPDARVHDLRPGGFVAGPVGPQRIPVRHADFRQVFQVGGASSGVAVQAWTPRLLNVTPDAPQVRHRIRHAPAGLLFVERFPFHALDFHGERSVEPVGVQPVENRFKVDDALAESGKAPGLVLAVRILEMHAADIVDDLFHFVDVVHVPVVVVDVGRVVVHADVGMVDAAHGLQGDGRVGDQVGMGFHADGNPVFGRFGPRAVQSLVSHAHVPVPRPVRLRKAVRRPGPRRRPGGGSAARPRRRTGSLPGTAGCWPKARDLRAWT